MPGVEGRSTNDTKSTLGGITDTWETRAGWAKVGAEALPASSSRAERRRHP